MENLIQSLLDIWGFVYSLLTIAIRAIFPNATFISCVQWTLGAVLTPIAIFYVNQKFNIITIQPKCKLKLYTSNRKKKLNFKHFVGQPTDYRKKVEADMAPIRQVFPMAQIDFNNYLELQVYGKLGAINHYNDWVNCYVAEKLEYLSAKYKAESVEEYLKPVQLVVKNVGTKAAGHIKVTLEIETTCHLYDSTCVNINQLEVSEVPDRNADHLALEFWTIECVESETFDIPEYDQNEGRAKSHYVFEADSLLHSSNERFELPPFYVDTRFPGKSIFSYTIIEGTIRKEVKSKIVIVVK